MPAPAVVIVSGREAVEVGLRVEVDRSKQRIAFGVVDVHPHVARLSEVRPQVAVVTVVALAHIQHVSLVLDPGVRLLRADSQGGVLDRQASAFRGDTANCPRGDIESVSNRIHLDRIGPDAHAIDHVWLVETLLAADVSSSVIGCPSIRMPSRETVDDTARLDFSTIAALVSSSPIVHTRPLRQSEVQRVAVVHLDDGERILCRQIKDFAAGHWSTMAARTGV